MYWTEPHAAKITWSIIITEQKSLCQICNYACKFYHHHHHHHHHCNHRCHRHHHHQPNNTQFYSEVTSWINWVDVGLIDGRSVPRRSLQPAGDVVPSLLVILIIQGHHVRCSFNTWNVLFSTSYKKVLSGQRIQQHVHITKSTGYLRYQPPLKLPFFRIWGFNVFK